MALSISVSSHLSEKQNQSPVVKIFLYFLLLIAYAESLPFNFTGFSPNTGTIHFEGDAFSSQNVLQLTKNDAINSLTSSVGRASYNQPVRLWDASNGKLTDFTTHFSFVSILVSMVMESPSLSHLLTPRSLPTPAMVEFDSNKNNWDPDNNHVGININSIDSVKTVTWNSGIRDGKVANAWVSFSASTGREVETHKIISWSFESSSGTTGKRKNLGLIVGLGVGFGLVVCGLGLFIFIMWRVRAGLKDGEAIDVTIDHEFEEARRRRIWRSLQRVIKQFQHGSGGELLVYEFLPNGSLDSHLFGDKIMLTWIVRYKIAIGLASALFYLHVEWEQYVVHRDIKSSNVMLDSNFSAKLGDFGLARLVDHDMGSQTTVLAGTMGYLAPECVTTGKASKESDVYSFGVVALEIACGRKPVEPRAEPIKVRLLEWVWDLYGKGQLLEAVDKRLGKVFDKRQIECLMITGLWCCHPDYTHRPSIRQVISVLNFEAPLPSLPSKLPVPMYYAPPMSLCKFTYTSSITSVTDSEKYRTQ
ncbi:L-type lectin-domain containing receptor kinase IX.2 [Hibiscus syriacus]|uniref:L-type lectin-domain containing receptor kinase IX.2 n=1 Tax=Hibiscus syriacus TaxID=106335 RepID=A0A6A3AN37_HIBSY|nr:L-type lectin-domain containing receptor kinase IX.2 [Hibiscus syriacus]